MTDRSEPAPRLADGPEKPDLTGSFQAAGIPRSRSDIDVSAPESLLGFHDGSPPYLEGALVAVQQSTSWQGPYPSPEAVERFEAVLPGAFDRILTMAEKAQASQIQVTENAQHLLQQDVRRSHYLGAGVSALAVVCSMVCALTNHPAAAIALVGIPVMAVARAFITSLRGDDGKAESGLGAQAPGAANQAANDPTAPG